MADSQTQSGNQGKMDKKKNDIITKYLADMIGVESHIYQAIDKQVKETKDEPDVNPFLTQIRDNFDRHVNNLRARLEALGGQATNPIKEAGAAVLGVAAGVIDKVRAEEVSKDFRDNYTAISLSNISYVMMITTAIACNDNETAELGKQNLRDNTQIVMKIGHLMSQLVVRDLSDLTNLNTMAVEQGRQAYEQAWQ